MKICSNKECKQQNPQPLDNFGFRGDKKDALKSRCKSCINEQNRNKPRTEEFKARRRAATAKHRRLHPEKELAQREKVKRDPDYHLKAREATAKHRRLYPEKVKEQNEKERQHPDYKEKRRIASAKHRAKDPDRRRKTENERNAKPENRKRRRASAKKSRQKNLGKDSAKSTRRYAAKKKRVPKWLTKEQHRENETIYKECADLQQYFDPNDSLQVDHIIPFQGENVSGLHVPCNLQILPRGLNVRKGNVILEEGSELYNQCEEFKKVLNEVRKNKNRPST